jgi:hypothetical protein
MGYESYNIGVAIASYNEVFPVWNEQVLIRREHGYDGLSAVWMS